MIPVYKEGDESDPSNYRPISMLPIFNKILELLIYRRLLSFLNANDFFYSKQYGFRERSGTHTAVYEVLNEIYLKLDDGLAVSALFLDLRKAFDCVDHSILMQKLFHAGIRGAPLNLLRDYLTNRQQCVVLGQSMSVLRPIEIGIPQGSVLGPLMFLIYINDICRLPVTGNATLFADDTGLFYSARSVSDNISRINVDLEIVRDFLDNNKLSLNVGKTKVVHVKCRGGRPDDSIVLDGFTIDPVRVYKYLGLLIDERVSWDAQVSKLCGKLSSVCGVLCKLKHVLPKSVLMKIYFALAHSCLMYLPVAWGSATKKLLKQLQVLQSRCLKHACKLPLRCPTVELFSVHCPGILNVESIIRYSTCVFVREAFLKHSYSTIDFQRSVHNYETRNKNLLRPTFVRTKTGSKAISAHGCSLYNMLPASLKGSPPIRFKGELKAWLLANQYSR